MPTQYICLNITHRDIEFLGNKGAETRSIQNSGHTDYALAWETTRVISKLGHSIQWIRDHDNDTVGRVLDNFPGDLRNDLLIFLHKVITSHARFTRKT